MSHSKKLRLNSFHGLKLIVIILLLACVIDAPMEAHGAPGPSRDWTLYPAVVEVDTEADFAAVSDPHGDYDRLLRVIQATGWVGAGLPTPKWTEGEGSKLSVLIVVGDLIDKGDNSLKVIELLRALQKEASARGGRVIVTMGNHEAEFLANWQGDKTVKFKNELEARVRELKAQGKTEEAKAFIPSNVANCEGELGQWLCQLPVAARVNDWFFCHAGNTQGRSIQAINSAIKAGFELNGQGFKTTELIGDNSILEARFGSDGPEHLSWFMEGKEETKPAELLRRYADALRVNHIVQGHKPGEVDFQKPDGKPGGATRKKGDIFQAYNGLLFLIDNDMSAGSSKRIGASLYIKGPIRQRSDYNGNVTAFVNCPNPRLYGREALWDSTKPVTFSGQSCGDQ